MLARPATSTYSSTLRNTLPTSISGVSRFELEAVLGHRVDVVPSRTLKPAIRENIMAEVVPI